MKLLLTIVILGILAAVVIPKLDKEQAQSVQKASLQEIAMPYTGTVNNYARGERIAPFAIETSAGSNYFVKLKDIYSNQTVMEFFIRGGDKISTKVPLGTYQITYASGKKWYGYNNLFGNDTSYSKTDQDFNFKQTYQGVSGYTITLYQVSNGNLSTSRLSPSQF